LKSGRLRGDLSSNPSAGSGSGGQALRGGNIYSVTGGSAGRFERGLPPNAGLPPGLKPDLKSGLKPGLKPEPEPGLSPDLNSGLDAVLNSGLRPGLNSGLNSFLSSGRNEGLKSAFDSC